MPTDLVDEQSQTFTVQYPTTQSHPVIFSSPHSGRDYPIELTDQTALKLRKLRSLEDPYVDELYDHVVAQGAPIIKAEFPRAYLDLNREPYELDPKLIKQRLPTYANSTTMRVKGGLGTIPRIVADGSAIYRQPIQLADALKRIESHHQPYHTKLTELLNKTREQFRIAILLDCHSMPSSNNIYKNKLATDVVIGNRFNSSCAPQITEIIAQSFKLLGFSVSFNQPYAGGYITEHYGTPENAIHAVQIELNRDLYLDQITLEKSNKFNRVKKKLVHVTGKITSRFTSSEDQALAAE